MNRIVVASANPAKVTELRAILAEVLPGVELIPRPAWVPDVDETDDTLVGNARLKARVLREAMGFASVADDTGLFVDALGGAPGVRTARFAGEAATDADNRAKLLRELGGAGVRTARFRTVIVLALTASDEVVAEGEVLGAIAFAERGANGFGYDPLFVPAEGDGRTFAEMRAEEKRALSHRGRALRDLATRLHDLGS